MTPTLHRADEEADTGAYGAYLRAQTDADLLDITQHTDPERYPARLDAARREMRRRHVLHLPVYTPLEYAVRYAALLAFALAALTLALAALLTEAEAAGPTWPGAAQIPDGVPLSRVGLLLVIALLRTAVVVSVRLCLYPLVLGLTGWWTLSRARRAWRHQARADVWRMACLALVALASAIAVSCGPESALPDLFRPLVPRGLILFNPFG